VPLFQLIDVTNASRTMLCNIATAEWNDTLLSLFGNRARSCRRPAGSDDRPGLFCPRHGQVNPWNRLLHLLNIGEKPVVS